MPEIVIEHLSKVFTTKDGSVEALRDVNISIDKGDIFGIIGMSGAGKSTLVRCMNFLEQPTEGKVMIEGKSLGDYSKKELQKKREEIAMIFQHFNLLMQKNVLENVCFPLYIQKMRRKQERRHWSFWRLWGFRIRNTHIRHSCREDRNREWQLPEPLQVTRKSCCVTRQPVLWIPRRPLPFWSC